MVKSFEEAQAEIRAAAKLAVKEFVRKGKEPEWEARVSRKRLGGSFRDSDGVRVHQESYEDYFYLLRKGSFPGETIKFPALGTDPEDRDWAMKELSPKIFNQRGQPWID